MSDEKTIETRTISVKDNSGKDYSVKTVVRAGPASCFGGETLRFLVYYKTTKVLGMTVDRIPEKNEYQNDFTAAWTFKLPKSLRDKEIGTRLWKEIEILLSKYRACPYVNSGIPLVVDEEVDEDIYSDFVSDV